MREEQEKIIVTSPGDLDIIREEFVELMRDSYVFASVTEAETL